VKAFADRPHEPALASAAALSKRLRGGRRSGNGSEGDKRCGPVPAEQSSQVLESFCSTTTAAPFSTSPRLSTRPKGSSPAGDLAAVEADAERLAPIFFE
jgi:hypothetical protein